MEIKIEKMEQEPQFEPTRVTFELENEEDLRFLFCCFNLSREELNKFQPYNMKVSSDEYIARSSKTFRSIKNLAVEMGVYK